MQQDQALLHAQAHDKAAANPRICGVIAWCAFDYASLINPWHALKCPGVADTFRIPKLGASFYRAQLDPKIRPIIEPNFSWDFSQYAPLAPGNHAAIFSNCHRLEVYFDDKLKATVRPDRAGFPRLLYPPFFIDLAVQGGPYPELRIDGFIDETKVLSRSFSPHRSADRLRLTVDDAELIADGADATRLAFGAADRFGNWRSTGQGEVALRLEGPGKTVGDHPFALDDSGGVGAVWIRTIAGQTGTIRVTAQHVTLGTASAEIQVTLPRQTAGS